MKIIQKTINTEDYYKRHIEIINPILPVLITPKEAEVLGAFMEFSGEIIEQGRFNPLTRKKVMTKLNLSLGGLSNYIGSLTTKGYIYKGENDILYIKQFLFPEPSNQAYFFKLCENKKQE